MKTKLITVTLALASLAFTNPETKGTKVYKVDSEASKIVWVGKKVTGEHTGNVSVKGGSLAFNDLVLKTGTIEMDMNTITATDIEDKKYNDMLVGHLKSDDFFGVEKFPKAIFILTGAKSTGKNTMDISGKLTIKGITNEITFPATVTFDDDKVNAIANVKIDRTKYDIKYGSGSFFDNLGDKAIGDDFSLAINLVAKK